MKRRNLLLSLVALMTFTVSVRAAVSASPGDLVKQTSDSVIERVKHERDSLRSDAPRLHALVDESIVPHFDFRRMSKWVLGKHWRSAVPAQRQSFVKEFQTLLVRTYASALVEFSNHEIRYLPLRSAEGARDVTVKTEVKQEGNQFVPITYRMYKKKDEWKVYDVAVDGISLLATYRSEFAAAIQRESLDGLISALARKNAKSRVETSAIKN